MTWHCLTCTGGREAHAVSVLDRLGYPGAWFPIREERLSQTKYDQIVRMWKMKGKPGHKPKRTRNRPWIAGYVFVQAEAMPAHMVKGTYGGNHIAPLVIGGKPVTLTQEDMASMRDMPETARQIVEAAQEAQRAAWRARMPVPGQIATVTIDGPLFGYFGVVRRCDDAENGDCEIDLGFGGYVTIAKQGLERLQL